ncbi:putative AMP dependent CoA ligase [Aspergillus bombycis]|uniref:Putative AMP dependent CoA ligase n=1 Tax=Aspergillus bombycis TaxID=109264 RepID=A0A1F8AIM9_9EURO|nr:putative AMP dependent CoA ligase [Aspergillus bombycis]OGM51309.1 putative AMP dependent CoA ligase [Aspergillus bombycis]
MLQVPREPLLTLLFQVWKSHPTKTIIRDLSDGYETTVGEFLNDILVTRGRILESLAPEVKVRLRSADTDVFVGVLVGPGHEFAVLAFALYSIGAVIVPLCKLFPSPFSSTDILPNTHVSPLAPALHPDEGKYFLGLCNAALIITVPSTRSKAEAISDLTGIPALEINVTELVRPTALHFALQPEGEPLINADKGFVLLYTSGTTGTPKGVLHSRRGAETAYVTSIELFGLGPSDTWAHYSPVHWAAGWLFLFHTILAGACLEFCSSVFSPDWLLEQWEKKTGPEDGLTAVFLVPSGLQAVGAKLEAVRREGPPERYGRILQGLRGMRVIASGGARVTPELRDEWMDLRGGKPLTVAYGMSEVLMFVVAADWNSNAVLPMDCCGRICRHVDLKINEAGEICIQTPPRFKRYISEDPTVMNGIFDADGYWKTGDMGKLEGDQLYVFGRASQDIIRFSGWKILAPEVESELAKHPLVSEAIVFGIQDTSAGQLVAALVVIRGDDSDKNSLDLLAVRRWLAVERRMNAYKLPTVLRVVSKNQELPMTLSGKFIKRKIRDIFFNQEELDSDRVHVHDFSTQEPDIGDRPFDWAGIQAK